MITAPVGVARAADAEWCIADTVFNVPQIPQLYDIKEGHREGSESTQYLIKVASLIEFSAFRGNVNDPPILDAMLGRKSDFALQQLTLGWMHKERTQNWVTGRPTYKVTPSGTILFTTKNLKLFGQPLFFNCHRGLPVYSKDANTHSCGANGFGPGSTSIRINFETGTDLEGHWPMSVEDWATQNWSRWAGPLQDVEDAIRKITATEKNNNSC